jgi:hypothetical protein
VAQCEPDEIAQSEWTGKMKEKLKMLELCTEMKVREKRAEGRKKGGATENETK